MNLPAPGSPVYLACQAALGLFSLALALSVVRLVKGPSLPDRVVALDLLAILNVGLICTIAVLTGQPVFLDVAIVVALVVFLGTIAFARYVEKKGLEQ